jgi:hypothetical protein
MLKQADLDRAAVRGCTVAGCSHDHGGQIFLHARCHIDAQVSAQYVAPDTLQVSCADCGQFVCRVAVEQTSIQKCHRHAPLEIEYTKDRGTLHVICNFCKNLIAEVPVLA